MQGSELEKLAELDWLAFRYIANELSDEERDAFESRLISEQSLREAVARAVELSQAVAVVSREMPVREMPATLPIESHRILPFAIPVGWMALGAAASLLLLFAIRWHQNGDVAVQNSNRPAAVQPGEPSQAVRELALYRAQSAEASETEASESPETAAIETVAEWVASDPGDESLSNELNSAPDELESPVPSWLLVAVSGEKSRTPQQPNQD